MNPDSVLSVGSRNRDTAHKISIHDILHTPFINSENDMFNYIHKNGTDISRVNIIGMIIGKEAESVNICLIDDGTGIIQVTIFNDEQFEKLQIGTVVMAVGRIREYEKRKYLTGEIVKSMNRKWAEVRQRELQVMPKSVKKEPVQKKPKESAKGDDMTGVFELVKQMDKGEGTAIEIILKETKIRNAEEIIKALLEAGDLFEVQPGKLKALE